MKLDNYSIILHIGHWSHMRYANCASSGHSSTSPFLNYVDYFPNDKQPNTN